MKNKSIVMICASLIIAVWCSMPAGAVNEANYSEVYYGQIMPFFETWERSFFYGVDHKKVAYAKYEAADEKGAIVLVPGWCDSYIKYAEFVYDLKDMGYSFYLIDNRGFGFSERLLDDPKKNYVEDFNDYVTDLKYFVDHIVKSKPHQRHFIIGHSLGGCIVSRYIEKYQYDFNAAILTSPMLQINTGSFPEFLAYPASLMGSWFGWKTSYAPTREPGEAYEFEQNNESSSRARWTMFAKDMSVLFPELYYSCQVNGDTFNYTKEGLEGTYEAGLNAWRAVIPVLMLQAEKDALVKPLGKNAFAAHAKNCTKILVPGSKHNMLIETDSIRYQAIDHILDFIEAHE